MILTMVQLNLEEEVHIVVTEEAKEMSNTTTTTHKFQLTHQCQPQMLSPHNLNLRL